MFLLKHFPHRSKESARISTENTALTKNVLHKMKVVVANLSVMKQCKAGVNVGHTIVVLASLGPFYRYTDALEQLYTAKNKKRTLE